MNITKNVTAIGNYSFQGCTNLAGVYFDDNIALVGKNAFADCPNLTYATFTNEDWYVTTDANATSGTNISVFGSVAEKLKSTYVDYYWKRNV